MAQNGGQSDAEPQPFNARSDDYKEAGMLLETLHVELIEISTSCDAFGK